MSQTMARGHKEEDPSVAFIIRACDMCRKKKIRCEIVADTCAQCIKYKTPCHFTPITMKRTPRRSPRDKRIQDLELRLKRMEHQLKRAVAQQSRTDYQLENALVLPESTISDHFQTEIPRDHQMDVECSFDRVVTPTAAPLQPLNSHRSLQKITTDFPIHQTQLLSPFHDSSIVDTPLSPLPPIDKGLPLIEKSFSGFNYAFPIFDRESFLIRYRSPETCLNDTCWWACLNVVLALSHRFTGTAVTETEQDREAWQYFKNAVAVSSQLITMSPSIQSVQALTGLALLFLGTPNHGPVSLLISTAIKSAQKMGLHRSYKRSALPIHEIEQRKRIFWSAYMIDKDLSLFTGQPPTQDDDDMDVELPSDNDPRSSKSLNSRIRLAMIQGKIYKYLCSVRARRQPPAERVTAARKLQTMLQSWKANVPDDILHENHGNGYDGVYSFILQLSYFNSLSTVYNSLPMFPMCHELHVPQHPEITYEARKAIRLLEVTPRRSYACLWAVFPIYVTASTTLLTYTLSKPTNKSATMDLQLSQTLLRLLVTLSRISEGKREELTDMYHSSVELFQKAKTAIESSNIVVHQKNPEPSHSQRVLADEGQKENVEDFLMRMDNIGAGYENFDVNLLSPSTLAWVASHNTHR